MMIKRTVSIITILAAALALTISASAQGKKAAGSMNARLFNLVQEAKEGRARLNPEVAKQVREDFEGENGPTVDFIPLITGTWNCTIAESDTGLPPFEALQTFGLDGTFTETSNLLGMGGEGPAHGAYERTRRGYSLTFELFVFDPGSGASVGRVRVRAAIWMTSLSTFIAASAVDFIDVDGTVIPDIDGGPFRGTKLQVRGV